MSKNRFEAFSDGVLAIIITIMVLEMKVPHGTSLESLKPLLPVFISYVLSFTMIGIYWNNHHHMLHVSTHINGSVLWANLHLLFWLSLFPFVTAWMGENHFGTWPVALYGIVAAMAGLAYYWLAHCLANIHGKESALAVALGKDYKGILSVVLYVIGIAMSFVHTWIAVALYVIVLMIWFIPDRRMESRVHN
ncbi:MAG: TMEM175 family protein [Ferruginibacter sp.]